MAAGQTQIEYGDTSGSKLVIHNCHTKGFRQEPVYDDSGADLMYWRFVVSVVGYCHNQDWWRSGLFITPVGTVTGDAASAQIQQRVLMEPRKAFTMRVGVTTLNPNGTVLLFAKPAAANQPNLTGVDVNNGPRGSAMIIENIVGNDIFKIQAEFEICKMECSYDGSVYGNQRKVLSNRWSSSDEIDRDRYTTRTYQGRLRIASGQFSPHEFRDLVVPPIQKGMRRERMVFAASADGLSLDYTITDQDVAYAAPDPATSWSMRHTESSNQQDIYQRSEIEISLLGDRDVDKFKLFALAHSLMESRLRVVIPPPAPPGQNDPPLDQTVQLLEEYSLTDETGDRNAVHLTARVKQAKNEKVQNVLDLIKKWGKPIDASDWGGIGANYDRNNSRFFGDVPPTEGPIPLVGILRCYLQSPCNDVHGIGEGPRADEPQEPITRGDDPELEAVIVEELPSLPDPVNVSADHKSAIYTFYRVESLWHTDEMKAAMPVFQSASRVPSTKPTTRVITLSAPQQRRTLRIQAMRVGRTPKLPPPKDFEETSYVAGQGNVVTNKGHLLQSRVLARGVSTDACGQPVHQVDAEYEYAMEHAIDPEVDGLRIGVNQWDTRGLQKTTPEMFTGTEDASGSAGQTQNLPPGQS